MDVQVFVGYTVGILSSCLIAQQIVCRFFFGFVPEFWPVLGITFLGLALSFLSGFGLGSVFGHTGGFAGVGLMGLASAFAIYTILWRFFVKNPKDSTALTYQNAAWIVFLQFVVGSIFAGAMFGVVYLFSRM